MSEAWDKELLDELGSIFSEAGLSAAQEDIEGRNVLVVEYGDDSAAEDCNVSVVHLTEDSTEVAVMITAMSGLGEKATADLSALLPYLNKYLSVGKFGITGDGDDGYFYFESAFVVDEDTERAKLMRIIAATIDICVGTAEEAIALTAPVISGEKPVSELMNEDTAIVQF